MNASYQLKLHGPIGGDWVEYRDSNDRYGFDLAFERRKWFERPTWHVFLPALKGDNYVVHELTEEERQTVLLRVVEFLSSQKSFVRFGWTFPVVVERREIPLDVVERRARWMEYLSRTARHDRP